MTEEEKNEIRQDQLKWMQNELLQMKLAEPDEVPTLRYVEQGLAVLLLSDLFRLGKALQMNMESAGKDVKREVEP